MSECCALQRKNDKSKPDLLVSQLSNVNVSEVHGPFISQGSVSLVDTPSEKSVTILRDTGASQSLILDSVLPFPRSLILHGMTLLPEGVELGIFNVPLHKICLRSPLVNGPVVLRVRPSLPVQGVNLILGNDLAGGKVMANSHILQMPCIEETITNGPELFSASAVTQAMSRDAPKQSIQDVSEIPLNVWLADTILDDKAPNVVTPMYSRRNSVPSE